MTQPKARHSRQFLAQTLPTNWYASFGPTSDHSFLKTWHNSTTASRSRKLVLVRPRTCKLVLSTICLTQLPKLCIEISTPFQSLCCFCSHQIWSKPRLWYHKKDKSNFRAHKPSCYATILGSALHCPGALFEPNNEHYEPTFMIYELATPSMIMLVELLVCKCHKRACALAF